MSLRPNLAIAVAIPLVLLASYFLLDPEAWQSLLIKLPRTHDRRIVGTWRGTLPSPGDPVPRTRTTLFRADGTGTFELTGPPGKPGLSFKFQWGTEGGVLYTKRMATDSWSATNRKYSVSTDGNTLSFSKGGRFDVVTTTMKRSTLP